MKDPLRYVTNLLLRIRANCCGIGYLFLVAYDQKAGYLVYDADYPRATFIKHVPRRIYIQVVYECLCVKTQKNQRFKGRKWYLSSHMTEDEIIKTAYAAFEAAVRHEIMEGFKVDGKVLFNPHVDYRELLKISEKEVSRI